MIGEVMSNSIQQTTMVCNVDRFNYGKQPFSEKNNLVTFKFKSPTCGSPFRTKKI